MMAVTCGRSEGEAILLCLESSYDAVSVMMLVEIATFAKIGQEGVGKCTTIHEANMRGVS